MNNYVEIVLRRNRGWPWPEDSWGLTPMFGEDGWCRTCGIPKQTTEESTWVLDGDGVVWDAEAVDPQAFRL